MREQVLYAEYGEEVIKLESASADFVASLFKVDIEDIDAKVFEHLILAYQSGNCNFDIEDSIGHYIRSVCIRISYDSDHYKNCKLMDTITKYSVLLDKILEDYDRVFDRKHYFIPTPLFNSDNGSIDDIYFDDYFLIPWDFFSVSEYYAACNILNLVGITNIWYMPLLEIVLNSRFTKYREYYQVSSEVNELLSLR